MIKYKSALTKQFHKSGMVEIQTSLWIGEKIPLQLKLILTYFSIDLQVRMREPKPPNIWIPKQSNVFIWYLL